MGDDLTGGAVPEPDAEEEELADGGGSAVPLASVVLWLPPLRVRRPWADWTVGVLVVLGVPLMIQGMELWMAVVAALVAVAVAGVAVLAAVRRRQRIARCRPSHLTVGEGYLELREGAGSDAGRRRWPLADVRSIRFKGAPFAAGGDVIIATAEGPVTVMTGPPAQRTKDGLKHVRAAARAQGFELGRAEPRPPAGGDAPAGGSGAGA